jgi:hypothetical protein
MLWTRTAEGLAGRSIIEPTASIACIGCSTMMASHRCQACGEIGMLKLF